MDVSRGKPDPPAFLLAVQRFEVAPARGAAVEDAPAGIAAALAAGMMAIPLTDAAPDYCLTEGAPAAIQRSRVCTSSSVSQGGPVYGMRGSL
jgi:beta-phosphoglucomutase-like phosphatase (HAD superfamily)